LTVPEQDSELEQRAKELARETIRGSAKQSKYPEVSLAMERIFVADYWRVFLPLAELERRTKTDPSAEMTPKQAAAFKADLRRAVQETMAPAMAETERELAHLFDPKPGPFARLKRWIAG
jgi:hypothetical protein